MTSPSTHLSDEQFTECAMFAPSAAAAEHLAACEACRAELGTLQQSLSDFRSSASAWSESKPKLSLRPLLNRNRRRVMIMRSAWAVATVALISISLPILKHHSAPTSHSASVASEDSPAQIAQDNQLMQSVYLALTPNDPSPLQEYRVRANGDRRSTATELRNQ